MQLMRLQTPSLHHETLMQLESLFEMYLAITKKISKDIPLHTGTLAREEIPAVCLPSSRHENHMYKKLLRGNSNKTAVILS